jgi:hypothetical protein
MKKRLSLGVTLFVMLFLFVLQGYASDVNLGISLSDGKLRSFYFSLSDYYGIPEEQIIILKKRYPIIIEEELPVILLIVREAGVSPDIIIDLRRRGFSWYDILIRFRIYPEVVFKRYIIYGPPYGKAWGHHKKKKRVVFIDDDIIALSNVKFISEYYRETPEVVIKYKEKYPKFLDVHYKIYEHKKGKKEKIDEERYYKEPRDYKDYRDRDYRDSGAHKDKKDKDKREKFLYEDEDKRENRRKHNGKKFRD